MNKTYDTAEEAPGAVEAAGTDAEEAPAAVDAPGCGIPMHEVLKRRN